MFNKIYRVINNIINIRRMYFDPATFVYDERVIDHRDYLLGAITVDLNDLPDRFILNDGRFQNQSLESYLRMSCTAQSTTNAINQNIYTSSGGRYSKKSKELFYSGKQLWTLMINKKLASLTQGAYIIDAIKTAKSSQMLKSYYHTKYLIDILNAIYVGKPVVTGSTKIDWSKCKDGLVKSVGSSYGHAFSVMGFDRKKVIGKYTGAICCENSYGADFQDKGFFWIPFDLVEDILFNTRKAIEIK